MTDSTLRFVVVNPAFLTMVGYSSEELQQMSLLDICVDGKGDEHRVPLRELCEGVRLQYELETQYRRKDGTSLPVISYLSAVSGQAPNQQTFLTLTVDVTARQAAEDALRTAQSELGRLARLTTVDAMAASIAHELNQPLASIVANGNAGLRWLNRPEPNVEEARLAFGRVVNEGHRAALVLAPAGFLMGFGFPTGMRLVSTINAGPMPWFWGINGGAGVLATSIAVVTSIAFSIDTTLRIGAVCYLLVAAPAVLLVFARARSNHTAPRLLHPPQSANV